MLIYPAIPVVILKIVEILGLIDKPSLFLLKFF